VRRTGESPCQRDVEPIDVASTDVDGMEEVRGQYPAFFSEAHAALSEHSGAPPTDPVAWVRRVCELRMAGESLTKATTRATTDLTPPAAH
jgi:hypothetical protein